jgi:EAL domain-containing protein (putative c-di-GMP-specific phosphodiesterase class I)
MPLNELKIDQAFVRDLLTDPNDAAIARTILALGESLGLGVTAEGVETAAQRDWLLAQGCTSMQGYLFGAPEPLEQLLERVTGEKAIGMPSAFDRTRIAPL